MIITPTSSNLATHVRNAFADHGKVLEALDKQPNSLGKEMSKVIIWDSNYTQPDNEKRKAVYKQWVQSIPPAEPPST